MKTCPLKRFHEDGTRAGGVGMDALEASVRESGFLVVATSCCRGFFFSRPAVVSIRIYVVRSSEQDFLRLRCMSELARKTLADTPPASGMGTGLLYGKELARRSWYVRIRRSGREWGCRCLSCTPFQGQEVESGVMGGDMFGLGMR
jgi:hypothetical protein